MRFYNMRQGIAFKVVSFIQIIAFIFSTFALPVKAYAQSVMELPVPGAMVNLSAAYAPVMLRAVKIHPDQPLVFDFIVDSGNTHADQVLIKSETQKLVKYFLASLTVPEKDLWVNLSPYEHGRIVPEAFGQTEMGRDLLSQDYILKQLTSSLLNPEKDLGREFWARVYAQVREKFGVTDISADTFNKVWIMPDSAQVYEMNDTAVLGKTRLMVMTEQDYLARENSADVLLNTTSQDAMSEMSTQIMREVIIPAIEEEVNTGKNFAPLRQVYQTLVLAVWYKNNLKESLLGQVYSNQNKIAGVDLADKDQKEKIYQRYIAAYKQGVFNFIKEETDPVTNETLPRKYFSGGNDLRSTERATTITRVQPGQLPADAQAGIGDFSQVTVALTNSANKVVDAAQKSQEEQLKDLKAEFITASKAKVSDAFSDGDITGAMKAYAEFLVSLDEYNTKAPALGGTTEAVTDNEKNSAGQFQSIEDDFKSVADEFVKGGYSTSELIKKYESIGKRLEGNPWRKVYDSKEGTDLSGFDLILKGIKNVLPIIEKLSLPSHYADLTVGMHDILSVTTFVQTEKGRVKGSPLTKQLLNKIEKIADTGFIYFLDQLPLTIDVFPEVKDLLQRPQVSIDRVKDEIRSYQVVIAKIDARIDSGNTAKGDLAYLENMNQMLKSRAVAMMVDLLREQFKKEAGSEEEKEANYNKFAIFSAPPGGGKGEVWSRVSEWYDDLVQKFVLIHSRNERPREEMGVDYDFRTAEFLEGEVSEYMFLGLGASDADIQVMMEKLQDTGYLVPLHKLDPKFDYDGHQKELRQLLEDEISTATPRREDIINAVVDIFRTPEGGKSIEEMLSKAVQGRALEDRLIKVLSGNTYNYSEKEARPFIARKYAINFGFDLKKQTGALVGVVAGVLNTLGLTPREKDEAKNKIIDFLSSSLEISLAFQRGEIFIAYVNKQAQAMSSEDVKQKDFFYKGVDFNADANNGNGNFKYEPQEFMVKGLSTAYVSSTISILEGGLAWFDLLKQDAIRRDIKLASVFLSPFSDSQLDPENPDSLINDKVSYAAGYAEALKIRDEEQADLKNPVILPHKEFIARVKKASEDAYNGKPNDADDVVKYRIAMSIHKREAANKKITKPKEYKDRCVEAALQVKRRHEYRTVLVNAQQDFNKDFLAMMYRLTTAFTYTVFGAVLDAAQSSNQEKKENLLSLFHYMGEDITMEELMISDLPIISEIAPFFNNDARAIRAKAVEWVDDLKAKFPGKYEDLTPYALLKGTDETGKVIPAFELFQVLDENGNLTDTLKPRGLVHYDGDWHSDARIFVFNSKGKVFLQMRGEDKDIEPALFAHAVGGHTKIGESALENAVREAREEIGVQQVDLKRLVNLGRNKEEVLGTNHAINRAYYTTFAYKLTPEEESNFKVDYTDGIDKKGTGWYTLDAFEADLRANPDRHVASFVPAFENENYLKVLKAFSIEGGSVDYVGKVNYENNLGGIDLNPASLNMTVERIGKGVKVKVDPAEIQRIKTEGVSGFTPVIINIVPVKSMLPALGFAPVEAVASGV